MATLRYGHVHWAFDIGLWKSENEVKLPSGPVICECECEKGAKSLPLDGWGVGVPKIYAMLLARAINAEACFPFVNFSGRKFSFSFHRPNGSHDLVIGRDLGGGNDGPVCAFSVRSEFGDHRFAKFGPIFLSTSLVKVHGVVVSEACCKRKRMKIGIVGDDGSGIHAAHDDSAKSVEEGAQKRGLLGRRCRRWRLLSR